jgi:serine/threonine protein kinase
MHNLPDFSQSGFEVIRQIGQNSAGGRVVYLAKDLSIPSNNEEGIEHLVAIKQFQFVKGADWSGFKAIEREMQVLQDLSHPGIPHYLGSFETDDGYCIVQEYKDAKPLSETRSYDGDRVKQIAIAVLEILVYLQNRVPPIIHRDIKPENILIDEQGNTYLIDFGFARIGTGEIAMSSVAAGTFGFMAPEQLRNRELNEATDLYGLGATLICLLTNTKSTAIDTITDDDGRINFKPLLPNLSQRFITWLERMVAPKRTDRFLNAAAALTAIQSTSIVRLPDVRVSRNSLELTATHVGEKLCTAIAVNSSVNRFMSNVDISQHPQLEGRWEIAPHQNDPPHTPDNHVWISVAPVTFTGDTECLISVDTAQLIASETYDRTLVLHTNLEIETIHIPIKVKTAAGIARQQPPYFWLPVLLAISTLTGATASYLLILAIISIHSFKEFLLFIIYFGGSLLITSAAALSTARYGATARALGWTVVGVVVMCLAFVIAIIVGSGGSIFELSVIFSAPLLYAIFGAAVGKTFKRSRQNGINRFRSIWLVLLVAGLGLSMGAFSYALLRGSGRLLRLALFATLILGLCSSFSLTRLILKGIKNRRLMHSRSRHFIKP